MRASKRQPEQPRTGLAARGVARTAAVLLLLGGAALLLGAKAPVAVPGPDLEAEAAQRPQQPPPETTPLDPAAESAPDGLLAAYEEVGLIDLWLAFPAMLDAPTEGQLGGPREGLTPREQLAFYAGMQAFARVYTVDEGLGPFYNDTSCGNCHNSPTIGGHGGSESVITVHAPAWTGGDAMGLRKHAAAGHELERAAGPTAKLRTPPLYGLGLLDAVPEEVRAALEDPDDKDKDGIRGRRSSRSDGSTAKPARFGQKANEWNLERFCAGAMVDEMSLTNTVRRNPRADLDKVKDPEVSRVEVMRIVAYVRNLARPPRGARAAVADQGAKLFDGIGCTGCHKPTLGTLEGAYTDTLLHDMGEGLAGLKDGAAGPRDWRTAPLWGLRFRGPYLHDLRAATIEEAIAAHGGEAKSRRDAFLALPPADKRAVLAFLESL